MMGKESAAGKVTMEPVVAGEIMLQAMRAVERKLRCLVWQRWKRVDARAIAPGFPEAKAWQCACNACGPWWSAGASHTNASYPAAASGRMGLVSLLETIKSHA